MTEQANDAAVVEVDVRELGKEQPARWLSRDPMADKYPGWSPYNYAACNPMMFVDPGGDSIVVLEDPSGAYGFGHAASLIGNDNSGWELYSKNGAEGGSPGFGPSQDPNVGEQTGNVYPTLSDFAESNDRYSQGYLIESDAQTDAQMKNTATAEVQSLQSAIGNNCMDAVSATLESGNFNGGSQTRTNYNLSDPVSFGTKEVYYNPVPNMRYNDIKRNNVGVDVSKTIYNKKK